MAEFLARTKPDSGVSGRDVPIPHLVITATTSGTAQTLYTVPNSAFLVKRLAVVNNNALATPLTLHSVPSGGSAGTGNLELSAYSIAANDAVDLTDLIQGFYPEGTTLEVFAGTGSRLLIHGWGEDRL